MSRLPSLQCLSANAVPDMAAALLAYGRSSSPASSVNRFRQVTLGPSGVLVRQPSTIDESKPPERLCRTFWYCCAQAFTHDCAVVRRVSAAAYVARRSESLTSAHGPHKIRCETLDRENST